jgi:histidyl-tRNA synthetase
MGSTVSDLRAPKGTFDVLPPDSARFLAVRETLTAPLRRAGYGYVETPIFEDTAVFSRGVGESTDVVTKEMYTFEDRGGRSARRSGTSALRPAGTGTSRRSTWRPSASTTPRWTRKWWHWACRVSATSG